MNETMDRMMENTLTGLRSAIDSENIVGKPIYLGDGTLIVPISKITMGFVSGGGEYNENGAKKNNSVPFAGAGGGGVNITPMGFLVCYQDKQTLIKVDENTEESKWKDLITAGINVMKSGKKN